MQKNYFLLLLCLLGWIWPLAATRAQSLPFTEDFESYNEFQAPAGWSTFVQKNTGLTTKGLRQSFNTSAPMTISSPAGIGPLTAQTQLFASLRVIKQQGFPAAAVVYPFTTDQFLVRISTDGGTTYTTVYTLSSVNYPANSTNFVAVNVPLGQFAGQSVKVAFTSSNLSGSGYFELDALTLRSVAASDLAVSNLRPASACDLAAGATTVSMTLTNAGGGPESNVDVFYKINNEPAVRQTVAGPLAAGAVVPVSFTQTANLAAAGTYRLKAWVAVATDAVRTNDTVRATITNYALPLPRLTFEQFTDKNLPLVAPGWREARGPLAQRDSADWVRSNAFGYATAKLPFRSGHDLGHWIVAPNVKATAATRLYAQLALTAKNTTDAWAAGIKSSHEISLKVSTDCGLTWTVLKRFTGAELTNTMQDFDVSLGSYAGGNVQVALFGRDDATFDQSTEYDLHVKSLAIRDQAATDVGVTALLSPARDCELSASTILTVRLRNYGTAAVSNIPVGLRGGPQATFAGPLAAGQTADYTFAQPVNLGATGTYTLVAYTGLAADAYRDNDSLQVQRRVFGSPLAPVTFTGYQSTAGFSGFTTNLGQIAPGWEEARTLNPGTAAAQFSFQPSYWVNSNILGQPTAKVNLAGSTYREWLVSPAFLASANSRFEFQAALTVPDGNAAYTMGAQADDALQVMVSTDCGTTWTKVGELTTASNLSNQLTLYRFPLAAYAGQKIRVALQASSGTRGDNNYDLHVDNLSVTELLANDLAVVAILSPATACEFTGTGQSTVQVRVRNNGTAAQTNFPMQYQLQNASTVTEQYAGTLAPGTEADFSFRTMVAVSAGNQNRLLVRTALAGDQQPANDSLTTTATRRLINGGSQINFDQLTATNFAQLGQVYPGWNTATGVKPSGTTSRWEFTNKLGTPAAKINIHPFSQYYGYDWIISQTQVPAFSGITFQVATTDTYNSTTPKAMGADDSLVVVVSRDCGRSWQRIGQVSSVNNTNATPRTFSFSPADKSGLVQYALYATNGPLKPGPDFDLVIDNISISVVTSTKAEAAAAAVQVYPNPAHQQFRVQLQGNLATHPATWTLTDLQGRLVRTGTVSARPEPTAGLTSGVYLLRVTPQGQAPVVQKLVIE